MEASKRDVKKDQLNAKFKNILSQDTGLKFPFN